VARLPHQWWNLHTIHMQSGARAVNHAIAQDHCLHLVGGSREDQIVNRVPGLFFGFDDKRGILVENVVGECIATHIVANHAGTAGVEERFARTAQPFQQCVH
jgi:hypothetical protein